MQKHYFNPGQTYMSLQLKSVVRNKTMSKHRALDNGCNNNYDPIITTKSPPYRTNNSLTHRMLKCICNYQISALKIKQNI